MYISLIPLIGYISLFQVEAYELLLNKHLLEINKYIQPANTITINLHLVT